MAEATIAGWAMFGLRRPLGRGGRLLAVYLSQIQDEETLTTPFEVIHACVLTTVEDGAADSPLL